MFVVLLSRQSSGCCARHSTDQLLLAGCHGNAYSAGHLYKQRAIIKSPFARSTTATGRQLSLDAHTHTHTHTRKRSPDTRASASTRTHAQARAYNSTIMQKNARFFGRKDIKFYVYFNSTYTHTHTHTHTRELKFV